jgi:hypothetical protein
MRYKDFKLTEEQLFEINMGMKSLRQLVKGIDARVGMEFEMIVPDVPKNEGGGEQEVDYDANESARDIDDICRFFHDGDHNGRREIDRLREKLTDEYESWLWEKTEDEWRSREDDLVFDYVKNNVDDDTIAEALGLEPDEDGNYPGYIGRVEYEQYAAKCVELENDYYDEAKSEFEDEMRNDGDYDQSAWLSDINIDTMSDVSDNYDITWPYYLNNGADDTEWDLGAVAEIFTQAVGRPAVAGGDYHALSGRERERINADSYILEIDGSLDADEDSDAGIEFVSPPLTVDEMISDLAKVKAMADKQGCYTSAANKTGLHINISVAGWKGIEGLDYVKLALLLGDEYILSQFERQSNHYCKSAMSIVKDAIQRNPESVQSLLDKMKSQLNTAASKLIHSGNTQKFTSINTKENRIEFRGPGGDWLNEFHDRIEPTLLRMVVALDAAVHEDKYKQEYQKKLYKLLTPTMDEYGAMVKDFSDYVSGVGGAPEQVVKDFRRAALSKLQQSNAGKKAQRDEAKGEWGALIKSLNKFLLARMTDIDSPPRRFKSQEEGQQWLTSKGLDPNRFEIAKIPPDYNAQTSSEEPVNNTMPEGPGPWEIYRTANGQIMYRLEHTNRAAAQSEADTWLRINNALPGLYAVRTQQSASQTAPLRGTTGNWGIWLDNSNRFAQWPGTPRPGQQNLRRFETEQAANEYLTHLRQNTVGMRSDVVVLEIPADYVPPNTSQTQTPAQPEGEMRWYTVRNADGFHMDFEARNVNAAMERARTQYPEAFNNVTDVVLATQPRGEQTTQQPNWETVNDRTGQVVHRFYADNQNNAIAAQFDYLTSQGLVTDDFTLQAIERTPPAQQAQQRVFRGEWQVVDANGRELYRFGGVGNSQSDANRVAAEWARRNMVSDEVNVVPVMA